MKKRKKIRPGKKDGRPRIELAPALEKVLYRCAARGFTQDQIASLLGISEMTLKRRLISEPRLMVLVKKAQAETIDLATSKVILAIRKGQAWAICFYLKCRAGWREKVEVGGEIKHTMDEQFAGAVQSAPKFVQDVIHQLPKREMAKLKNQYAAAGMPEPRGRIN